MKDTVKAGLLSLLEGDRDTVLSLFPYESSDPEIIWLKAQSVESNVEKVALLTSLVNQSPSEYTNLAAQILSRENKYEEMLSKPPSYKFWFKKKDPDEIQTELDE